MSKVTEDKLALAQGKIRVLSVGVSEYLKDSGFANLKVCAEDARRVVQTFREVKELSAATGGVRLLSRDKDASAHPTRGYIYSVQRAHIVANWPPVYIGKESDKHWEEGEDLSLLDFNAIQYTRKGMAIATKEQLRRMAKVPKREFMRRGVNQHTLEKICASEPVRAIKLAKSLRVLEDTNKSR